MTLTYKNVVLKRFSAGCTKIDWRNWIYLGDMHKIADFLKFAVSKLSFRIFNLSFGVFKLSFGIFWKLSFGQNAKK